MKAAIYARKSTEQGSVSDEQKSVARQIDHARAFAAAHGWTVDDSAIFVDDGISGAEFARRPGFLRLMNSLKPRPAFQVLIMSEESRLGREAIETAYALKQLVTAGVHVWFYMEGRERTLDSPTDKIMLSLTAFADEIERERGRQRTYDAMIRKARAGHVTGGRLFGYENVEVVGPDGNRSHVERRIVEAEAAVIRRIFELAIEGRGLKAIARQMNDERAISPMAQRGRSRTWAPTSVREVLYRDTYRGVITWNRTKKRDQWGAHHQTDRPEAEWVRVPAPHLQIVTEAQWQQAHGVIAKTRALLYGARALRRPYRNVPKFLLTGLVACGVCGSPLYVRSGTHGKGRKHGFICSGYHLRGRTVCPNRTVAPMADTDEMVLEALLDEVLDPSILTDAVDSALALVRGDVGSARATQIDGDLAAVDQERARLVEAIAAGGQLDGLLEALKARDARRRELEGQRELLRTEHVVTSSDVARVRAELLALAHSWRTVLAHDPEHARPIVVALLVDRVTLTPMPSERGKRWNLRGVGTLAGLFERQVFQLLWRPHRDSNPGFSLERAAS